MHKYKHLHFIGIKGVAMTALAILAKEQGSKVTGSDIAEEFITDEILKKHGISWNAGFSEKNLIGKPDLVVVTGAHGGMTNPEALAANLRGLPVVMQGKALGMFMEGYKQICVSGSHGKTTTAALTAFILEKTNLKPSYAIGCADVPSLKGSSYLGKGKYFVAEADEYATDPQTDKTPRFLWQKPEILVVTNIEYDHADVYENIEEVIHAFEKLVEKITEGGLLITCIDYKISKKLIPLARRVVTYGRSPLADWKIIRSSASIERTNFWLEYKGREMGCFQLSLPGEHNVYNATAAIIASLEAGIDIEKIRKILPLFTGTKRRFEKIAEKGGIRIYDDYAHHPTEIKATLKAAKEWFPQERITVIFQPHTYSRTKALFKEFSLAFNDADVVIISDIYSSAREKETFGVSSKTLVEETSKNHPRVLYLKGREEVVNYLKKNALPGDVIITMGAGDVYKWHEGIKNVISK